MEPLVCLSSQSEKVVPQNILVGGRMAYFELLRTPSKILILGDEPRVEDDDRRAKGPLREVVHGG